jgi:hypothetical protein
VAGFSGKVFIPDAGKSGPAKPDSSGVAQYHANRAPAVLQARALRIRMISKIPGVEDGNYRRSTRA